MAKSRTLVKLNDGEFVEQQKYLFIAGGHAKWYKHFGKKVWQFLMKLDILYYTTQQLYKTICIIKYYI